MKPAPNTGREYVEGILAGDRVSLSRAITLIESTRNDHQQIARQVIELCLPYAGRSFRIGVTGVPGVGKSTFVEALGTMLTGKGRRVAVLAVDPTSKISGGSILGDKTRMEKLAASENAFIRPSPSKGVLGGVSRATRETITLCEAAGYDTIFIETVGVGQSEISVHYMVDFFLLLMLPGAGDELQGIKRGIMEMADGVVINKAEGENRKKAMIARNQCENALHYLPPPETGWTPKVTLCSALSGEGVEGTWKMMSGYRERMNERGWILQKRKEQAKYWLHTCIEEQLREKLYASPKMRKVMLQCEKEVMEGKASPFYAAKQITDTAFF